MRMRGGIAALAGVLLIGGSPPPRSGRSGLMPYKAASGVGTISSIGSDS
jgi:hypothetical protein